MKIINKKECYHLNDILDDDFFNMRENRLIPLSLKEVDLVKKLIESN